MRKLMSGLVVSMVAASVAFAADEPTSTTVAGKTAVNTKTEVVGSALRIGVVDIQKVVQLSPETQVISKQLEQKFKPRQEKIEAADKALQAQIEKLNRDNAVLAQAEREKLSERVAVDRRELARMQQDFQEDANNAQHQAMQGLFGKIQASIDVIAKQNHYDLILQKYGVPYASNTVDITDQVVKSLQKSNG